MRVVGASDTRSGIPRGKPGGALTSRSLSGSSGCQGFAARKPAWTHPPSGDIAYAASISATAAALSARLAIGGRPSRTRRSVSRVNSV